LTLAGKNAIRQHFARAAKAPFRLEPFDLRLHLTQDDPELVVAEYQYRGEVPASGTTFVAANVQVVRVRDGLIISSRDYHDHAVMATAAATATNTS
jgi:ketosteroid isomerase-like protein